MDTITEEQRKLNVELAMTLHKTMPGGELLGIKFAYMLAGIVIKNRRRSDDKEYMSEFEKLTTDMRGAFLHGGHSSTLAAMEAHAAKLAQGNEESVLKICHELVEEMKADESKEATESGGVEGSEAKSDRVKKTD